MINDISGFLAVPPEAAKVHKIAVSVDDLIVLMNMASGYLSLVAGPKGVRLPLGTYKRCLQKSAALQVSYRVIQQRFVLAEEALEWLRNFCTFIHASVPGCMTETDIPPPT